MFLAIVTLAWPTLLEQMLQTLVQYIDAAMVGRIGTVCAGHHGSRRCSRRAYIANKPSAPGLDGSGRKDKTRCFSLFCHHLSSHVVSKCDYYFWSSFKGSWRYENPYAGKCLHEYRQYFVKLYISF